jgi:hypothetical protein
MMYSERCDVIAVLHSSARVGLAPSWLLGPVFVSLDVSVFTVYLVLLFHCLLKDFRSMWTFSFLLYQLHVELLVL